MSRLPFYPRLAAQAMQMLPRGTGKPNLKWTLQRRLVLSAAHLADLLAYPAQLWLVLLNTIIGILVMAKRPNSEPQ